MPTQQEIEDYIRNAGAPIQQGAQQLGQSADAAIQQRLQALQSLGSGGPTPTPSAPNIPQAQPIPQVLPNSPTMSPQDAQSRTNAMIAAPMTMDKVAAKLRAQANDDEAAEQHQNALEGRDMSGYSDYGDKPVAQAPRQFSSLKQRMQAPADIRDSMQGMQEVTPELEQKLGYGDEDDEDDEQKNAGAGSTKDTGTRGGV